MKQMKSTMMAIALCVLGAGANAQTVTVTDVEALPGETVAFTLDLAGGKPGTYTAMQFDAQFPTTGFTTTGKYSVSELWENASATIGSVDAEGQATIPVSSTESISTADVEGLLSVSFVVGSNVAIGEYDVTLKNLWFGYGTNSKDYLDDVSFKVKVVAAHNIVLDENSTTAPEAAEGVNARVLRTISADIWNTICLPFAMTAEQVKAAFGDDVQLADFKSWEATDWDDDDNTTAIQVKFTDVSTIEANRPYIIKVSQPITEFTVDDVDIDAEDEPSVTVGRMNRGTFGSFTGTYVPITIEEECLFLNSSKFWYSTGSSTMKGFRAYFWFQDVIADYTSEAGSGARISFSFDDATGINASLRSKGQSDADVYNLQGQRVTKPGKGLFIKNGKKVIVK